MTAAPAARRDLQLAALVAAVVAIFVLKAAYPAPFAAPAAERATLWIGSLSKLALQATGVLLAWRCARAFDRGGPAWRAWRLLAAAQLCWLAGQSVLAPYQLWLGIPAPYPSPADACFVLSYPLLYLALMASTRAYVEAGLPVGTPGERRALRATLALAGAAAMLPALVPIARAEAAPLHRALNLAYPLLDLGLVALVAPLARVAWRLRGGRLARVWQPLTCGVVGIALGDLAFAWLSTFGLARFDPLVDAAYVMAYGALAVAGLAQRDLLRG